MRRVIKQVEAVILNDDLKTYIVSAVGIATFFFGFGAAALLNLYLLSTNSPLVLDFRSSLTYRSAILGDGIILPIVNMIAMVFLLKHWQYVHRKTVAASLVSGFFVTVYFHVSQAVNGLVNWAMPTPWHWNMLGLWHAIYMLSVCSFLSLFYIVLLRLVKRERELPREVVLVTIGIVIFLLLLRIDYLSFNLSSLFPRR